MKNACIAWAMASLLHQTWKCSEKEPKIKESHTRKRVGVGRELNDNLWYFNYKKDNWKSEWKKFCGRFFSAFLYILGECSFAPFCVPCTLAKMWRAENAAYEQINSEMQRGKETSKQEVLLRNMLQNSASSRSCWKFYCTDEKFMADKRRCCQCNLNIFSNNWRIPAIFDGFSHFLRWKNCQLSELE